MDPVEAPFNHPVAADAAGRAVLAGLAFFVGVTCDRKRQARAVAGMAPMPRPLTAESRSSTSRAQATPVWLRHVAKRLGAAIYQLDVPEYELGLGGLAVRHSPPMHARIDPAACQTSHHAS